MWPFKKKESLTTTWLPGSQRWGKMHASKRPSDAEVEQQERAMCYRVATELDKIVCIYTGAVIRRGVTRQEVANGIYDQYVSKNSVRAAIAARDDDELGGN